MKPLSICLNLLAILFALILAPTAKSQTLSADQGTKSFECMSLVHGVVFKFNLPAANKAKFVIEVESPSGSENFEALRLSDGVYFSTKSLKFEDSKKEVGPWISAWLDDEREGSHKVACRRF